MALIGIDGLTSRTPVPTLHDVPTTGFPTLHQSSGNDGWQQSPVDFQSGPLVAAAPQDAEDINDRIRMCANRFTRLQRAFNELAQDLQTRIERGGGSLEGVLSSREPIFPGGPTVQQRAEELLAEIKAFLRSFDDSRCPELISPEARNAYHDLKGQIGQLERQVRGAGGYNIDLGGAAEGIGKTLVNLLGIMRRLDPSYAH